MKYMAGPPVRTKKTAAAARKPRPRITPKPGQQAMPPALEEQDMPEGAMPQAVPGSKGLGKLRRLRQMLTKRG